MSATPRVCLAIASFRFDEAVIALLESVFEQDNGDFFAEVLVVDSMGTGAVPEAIAANGWDDRVQYFDHAANLGSAGNLARRLELAAERGHDWAYAITHDGDVDVSGARSLLACGAAPGPVGA